MKEEIINLLQCDDEEINSLFQNAEQIKLNNVGNKVYLRGLIEYSNICRKNCFYCGIRKENSIKRFQLTDEEVIDAVVFAHKNNFASIVIQSGEIKSKYFTNKISNLLNQINQKTNNELGITLSLGEQTEDTLKEWKNIGQAKRYLLRIETSNKELYSKIHPNTKIHSYSQRLETLHILKDLGYQVGTGTMVGLPFQTIENLADDILFFIENDIDMIGLGPYIEHEQTPLYNNYKNILIPNQKRLELTLKMIAIIRIYMPTINIASTTALQTLSPQGKQQAIKVGANVIMPNISPLKYRKDYFLYENKTDFEVSSEEYFNNITDLVSSVGCVIGLGEQGNSLHFQLRN